MKGFIDRHIGTIDIDKEMLQDIGLDSIPQLMEETIPEGIIEDTITGKIPDEMSEYEFLNHIKKIADKNSHFKSLIGRGYYGTITPSPILRNVFQNPAWYTQYTPYQAEISQGRLEALLNFQTMVSDLTGLPLANASLLDEGTAAAEAMALFYDRRNKKVKDKPLNRLAIVTDVFEQTDAVLKSRAQPLEIEVQKMTPETTRDHEDIFAVLIQYPDSTGHVDVWNSWVEEWKSRGIFVIVAADILSLAILTPPGEWGADAVVGTTQRLGVPMGYGGPHAAYFATKEEFKRVIPGRIIGLSVDRMGKPALRMALQTREQHIKREKATSNICTAQALLAIMASFYGIYHGPDGIRTIAQDIHQKTTRLFQALSAKYEIINPRFFDTLTIQCSDEQRDKIIETASAKKLNFWAMDGALQLSLDETCSEEDLINIAEVFDVQIEGEWEDVIPKALRRQTSYMQHPVFHMHHSETQLMRYIKSLEQKDLSLVHSMIPLGSCTMKLNAATQLIPVSYDSFAHAHPFAPTDQMKGYFEVFDRLSSYLCAITGFKACSLQPNSGAQGEFTGLTVISSYHLDRGDTHRNVVLIPASAHGTNPASAVMVGMKVVVIATDDHGNIDMLDLENKAIEYSAKLSALMVTYPSTHGVFETEIKKICQIIHDHGGLVYMDGANMNAQVGYTSPGTIGADVCHLNLHKTFAIPHGGGGPGMGPICVNEKLEKYLPGHPIVKTGGTHATPAVSSAPFGSASILLISYAYIRLLGARGLKSATAFAILNANYIRHRLQDHYEILYTGENGRCAHELIVDLRQFKAWVSAEDVAKRLIDYGFHAPTLAFPVPGTLMIEPTESEDKREIDRFCEAMIGIKEEIDEIARGDYPVDDNVLVNAPHPLQELTEDEWGHSYTRNKAAYPSRSAEGAGKFWATIGRVNSAYGDRNLICTCPPIEDYMI